MSLSTTDISQLRLQEEQVISCLYDFCRNNGYSMAIWREPGAKFSQGIIDFESTVLPQDFSLDDLAEGFLFAPYDRSAPVHHIKACVYFSIENELILRAKPLTDVFGLRSCLEKDGKNTVLPPVKLHSDNSQKADKASFEALVAEAVSKIKAGEFLKVVPSRSKSYQVDNFAMPGQYLALKKRYPDAFVNATYTPQHGLWMGATPELLLSVTNNRYFETIALAGTQPYKPDVSTGDITWTQKEIEEQALVSRYIINCFKKIRLREFEELGPKTVIAGNLIHLKTRFLVDMKATGFPELGSVMLNLLHPTSAICGMPRDRADSWLKEYEAHDREFFTGYLGPVNLDNKTSLYVNLRCMKVEDNRITFFAGAGVTEDSKPEKEWSETEMKMNTLLDVIREHSTDI